MNEKKSQSEPPEEYDFLTETIKEKPADHRPFFVKLAGILAGAVLFGVVAAFVFALVVPKLEQRHTSPQTVKIPEDDPEITATPTPVPTQTPLPEEVSGIDQYKDIVGEIQEVARSSESSIVTVAGISSVTDWFNNIDETKNQTSGIVVANNGQEYCILTSFHVLQSSDRISVTFTDGTMAEAQLQKKDSNTDLALIKVPIGTVSAETQKTVTEAKLGNSYGVMRGDTVIAIGSPMGYSNAMVYGQVVSVTNTVSAQDVSYTLINTDISGSVEGSGALINMDGEVVGIITQIYSTESTGSIITAVSVSQLKSLIEDLSNNIALVYLGIKGDNVTDQIAQSAQIPQGVFVTDVAKDSPAMTAGVQIGDIITKFNSADIKNMLQYTRELQSVKPGDKVTIKVMRQGPDGYVEVAIEATVAEQP